MKPSVKSASRIIASFSKFLSSLSAKARLKLEKFGNQPIRCLSYRKGGKFI